MSRDLLKGPEPLRVLLVDDEVAILEFMTEALTRDGCFVSPASTAEHALDLLAGHPFDLVVADIRLPGLSGLDLLRAVSGMQAGVPVVLVTGFPSVDSAVLGLRHRAFEYLTKPVSIAQIHELIEHVRQDRQHGRAVAPVGLTEELARRQLALEGLFRIGALALQDLDPGLFVETALAYVAQGLRSQAVVLLLRDADGEVTPRSQGQPVLVRELASVCHAAVDDVGGASGRGLRTVAGPDARIMALAAPLPGAEPVLGILGVGRDRQQGGFLSEEKEFLVAYALTLALGLQKISLRERIENDPTEVMSVFVTALESLEARDRSLTGHSARVSLYAGEVATVLSLPAAQVAVIRRAGLLHDLGKLVLPESVLLKPGPLTEAEYALVRRHPMIGGRILRRLRFFAEEAEAVQHHLERYDGSGAPDGLQGDAIPLAARILAVADAFDAMMSPRPYRSAFALDAALEELSRDAGTHFDPTVIQAFGSIPRARLFEVSQYYGPRTRSSESPFPGASSATGGEAGGGSPPPIALGPGEFVGQVSRGAEDPPPHPVAPDSDSNAFVVAPGHEDLIEEIKAILGGTIRVVENPPTGSMVPPPDPERGARADG